MIIEKTLQKMNGEKISDDKIHNILESIRLAPTSYGLQPFKVIVVSNPEMKAKLLPACYGQTQIVDSSHVLVFAAYNKISEEFVAAYMQNIATTRGQELSELDGFKNMLNGSISNHKDLLSWTSRQAYIALGFASMATALEKVDAVAMEGFVSSSVDEILGLSEQNLNSVCILAIGKRDEANDKLAKAKKARQDESTMFTFIK